MAKTLFLNDFGIFPNTGKDCSKELQQVLNSLEDGVSLQFKKGTYHILKCINISDKKGISILGNCATIIAHFDPCGPISENNDVFNFLNCSDVEVKGFFFDTDNPIGATGEVVGQDVENGSLDIKIFDEFPVTGYEHFIGTNSFDEKGSPDYVLATIQHKLTEQEFTAPDGKKGKRLVALDYDVIAPQTVRLKYVNNPDKIRQIKTGHLINIRYEIYGTSIFNFESCHRFTLKDIIIYSAASFGAKVRPRSSDFTFDNFSIRVPDGSKRLKAANADGIHILGLYGTLTLKNCNMEGMGDDTLNIHGIAGEVYGLDKDKQSLSFTGPDRAEFRKLPNLWAAENDEIFIYDRTTFLRKGSFKVKKVENIINATYYDLKGEIADGDVIANSKYYASVHVDGCTLRNTRARGLLFQTHNILIENSYIYGMSLPAMLFSPDIRVWYEVGPCKNVEIRNNVIEYCGHYHNGANVGAIVFKACHDVGGNNYPAGVHEDIYIHDNIFTDNFNSGIYVSAAKNIRIENNRFEKCCQSPQNPDLPHAFYDIVTVNCENVSLSGNTTDREEKLYINLEE